MKLLKPKLGMNIPETRGDKKPTPQFRVLGTGDGPIPAQWLCDPSLFPYL